MAQADGQVAADQYDSWSHELCSDIEIVDGIILGRPRPSKRHRRIAKVLAVALEEAAGDEWNADIDFDLRLQDVSIDLTSI